MTEVHSCSYFCDRPECVKAQRDELRSRLAQPEQEPVFDCPRCGHCCPQRTWVGLTEEQIKLVMDGRGEEDDDDYVKPAFDQFGISEDDLMNFALAIEAKLKEKNT